MPITNAHTKMVAIELSDTDEKQEALFRLIQKEEGISGLLKEWDISRLGLIKGYRLISGET